MRQLCRQAKTSVLGTHSMASIRQLCDEAIWMHEGRLRMMGDPDSVVAAYTDFLEVNEDDPETEDDV
jgi:ABC-type polysaccharide/polyol phosphate transport system ATPase subunit